MVDIKSGELHIIWSVEDVICTHTEFFEGELSREDAISVLVMLDSNHDANVGITWDSIYDALLLNPNCKLREEINK